MKKIITMIILIISVLTGCATKMTPLERIEDLTGMILPQDAEQVSYEYQIYQL